jgi:hypothetical protein
MLNLPACLLACPFACLLTCPCLPACLCCCQVLVVNGKPFPTVRANVGDRIIIKVINQIDDPIRVHW